MRDETIVAFVITRDGPVDEADLRAWCTDRLASFRLLEFFAGVEAMPRTSVGKIQKQTLHEAWHTVAADFEPAGQSAGQPRPG
jgi:non-ribosomal peptide synthetase component E (peptide arylation enzyme)